MPTTPIPSFVVVAGIQQLGPFPTNGSWSDLDLVLDIVNLTRMDVLVEFSSDGGVTWRKLVEEIGLAPSINLVTLLTVGYHLVAGWTPPLPDGLVRCTIDNDVAFLSTGGSLTLSLVQALA